MKNIIFVGLGGFLGSVGRYLLGLWIYEFSNKHWFPFDTLSVNVIGCFFIGFIATLADTHNLISNEARLFIIVGLLGGFTTFSAFGNETVNLYKQASNFAALLNVTLNIVLCVFAAWAGSFLTRMVK